MLTSDEYQAFLEKAHLPLFKLFADVSEVCRDMVIGLTSTLFRYAQDLPSPVLDHFFAVGFCWSVQTGSSIVF